MNYYIKEIQTSEGVQKTAGIKARDDADYIFKECGFEALLIEGSSTKREKGNFVRRLISHMSVNAIWKKSLSKLKKGDRIFVQFPCVEHSIFLSSTLKKMTENGIEIVLLIHDLELLRIAQRKDVSWAKKVRLRVEEKNTLLHATKIIAHNESMKKFLSDMGIEEKKISTLEIFDYLIPNFSKECLNKNNKLTDPVIIAGNLRRHKAEYAYHLPQTSMFNLYGVGYEVCAQSNIDYKGSFDPNELIYAMEGSFGLVWDGQSEETCMGVYGDYLRINNPHKTSLYLAAEKPIIIWREAALANFVKQNHCGILINSLNEIAEVIKQLSDEEYREILYSAQEIGKRVRKGFYLKKAVMDII